MATHQSYKGRSDNYATFQNYKKRYENGASVTEYPRSLKEDPRMMPQIDNGPDL